MGGVGVGCGEPSTTHTLSLSEPLVPSLLDLAEPFCFLFTRCRTGSLSEPTNSEGCKDLAPITLEAWHFTPAQAPSATRGSLLNSGTSPPPVYHSPKQASLI